MNWIDREALLVCFRFIRWHRLSLVYPRDVFVCLYIQWIYIATIGHNTYTHVLVVVEISTQLQCYVPPT
jgi:hypothetical protein